MLEININKLNKNYGENIILKDFNLEVYTKEIISIVGDNGSGKSTLLKLISGIEKPSNGKISINKNSTLGLLNQIHENDSRKVIEILKSNLNNYDDYDKKLKKIENKMKKAEGEEQTKLIIKYLELQESNNFYKEEEKLGKIIDKFKLEKLLNNVFDNLSGGEKTIVTLAALLLKEPNILLLDEPTNHLDIDTLEWFEDYLKQYNGTILIVSHDRYFLDKVSNKTILIENGKEIIFNGNYSFFLEENEKRKEKEYNEYMIQKKEIAKKEESIKKLREWARIGDNERLYKKAKSIEKRIEKMDKKEKPKENTKINLNFEMDERSGKDVLVINNFNLKYDKNIFCNACMNIKFKERVCLIGPNGSGKSSLIKEILKDNQSIKKGSNLKIGYIPQIIVFDNENLNILEEAKRFYYNDEEHLRSSLFHFNFKKEDINKKIKSLSGGEKVRLLLFCLMQEKINFLILDEPTNHIDIQTKEILEKALLNFDGTIFFVSHDRYFINNIATRIVSIENNKLISYIGNYDDYKLIKNKK